MWHQWLGLAGQRLGGRRLWTADLLSNNRHAHDSRAGARGWRLRRSDRLVAGNLLEQLAGRVEERQHDSARVRWRDYSDTDTNADTNANADADTDADTDADADADTDADTNANAVAVRNRASSGRLQRQLAGSREVGSQCALQWLH